MAKPSIKLMSPVGTTIVATLERLRGRAMIAPGSARQDPLGGFDFDYEGTTEIIWEDQTTVKRDEERVFLDAKGSEFLEDELKLVPVGIEVLEPSEQHVITVTMEGGLIHEVEGIPQNITVRVVDFDTEGADPEAISTLPTGQKACISEWQTDPEANP
jgi:hypothetical protein